MQANSLQLQSKLVGALPIIDHFMRIIELRRLLLEALKHPPYVDAVLLLIKSILVQPNPLYRIHDWSLNFDPALVYGATISDDTLARALDRLFLLDRASLMTRVTLQAIKKFELSTNQIHNDTTSIKFFGHYRNQNPKAVTLKRGHSKDHRGDLLQIVYGLCVTADGAIPIHFKAYDGNQTDDTTHWETWLTLRGMLRRSDFIYVADSKLCVTKTLMDMDHAQGRFVTIVPRTRMEHSEFAEKSYQSTIRWQYIFAKRSTRKHHRRDVVESACEFYQMREGFRLYWFRSSEKLLRDKQDREDRLQAAMDKLTLLNSNNKRGPKTEAAMSKAAQRILTHYNVTPWVNLLVKTDILENYKQVHPGKPTTNTVYQKTSKKRARLLWSLNQEEIARAQAMDGIFPLTTNTNLSALEVYKVYKYQPTIEKRHSLLKSVCEISPVFLKKNDRIDALVFVYFMAQCIASLIERCLRKNMLDNGIKSIPVLPENRQSKTPSVRQILQAFEHHKKHELYNGKTLLKTFTEPLNALQKQLLNLLGIPENSAYL